MNGSYVKGNQRRTQKGFGRKDGTVPGRTGKTQRFVVPMAGIISAKLFVRFSIISVWM
jgi:hypothetical protein